MMNKMDPRLCIDCGIDISKRGNRTQRCTKCQQQHRHRYFAKRDDRDMPKSRQKKRICVGTDKPRLGGIPRRKNDPVNKNHDYPREKYGHIAVPAWAHALCWENEKGEMQDRHTLTLKNTQFDENYDTTSVIISMKTEVIKQYDHYLAPERIAEIHAKFHVLEPKKSTQQKQKLQLYRNWKYWQQQK